MLVSLDLVHALLHVSQIINMQAAQLAADLAPTFSMFKMDIYSSILCLLSAVDALAVASSSGQAAFPASARAQPPDTLRGIPLNHCCRVLQRRRGFRPPCQRLLCQPSLAPPHPVPPPSPLPQRRTAASPPPPRRHLAAVASQRHHRPQLHTPLHTPLPLYSTLPLPLTLTLTSTLLLALPFAPLPPSPPPLLQRSGARGLPPMLCAAAVLGKLRVRFRARPRTARA